MTLFYSPFTFFFSFLYFSFLFFSLFISDFYVFWVFIEILMFLLIGIFFSTFSFGTSNIILYFLVQSLSSLGLLVFFSMFFDFYLFFFLLLNLSLFPFFFWFYPVAVKLNNYILFLVSTYHNVPSLYILTFYVTNINYFLLFISIIFTFFFASSFIYSCLNLRDFIIFSSVSSTCWFAISCLVSFTFFIVFFVLYCLNLIFIFYVFGSSYSVSNNRSFGSYTYVFFLLLAIGGFPPFPIFFFKLYLIFFIIFISEFSSFFYFVSLLVVVYNIVCYLRISFNFMTFNFSSPGYYFF